MPEYIVDASLLSVSPFLTTIVLRLFPALRDTVSLPPVVSRKAVEVSTMGPPKLQREEVGHLRVQYAVRDKPLLFWFWGQDHFAWGSSLSLP